MSKDYCDHWALVYDQFRYARDQHRIEREFYLAQARECRGPVLELACGTGIVLLALLEAGVDAYGLDISQSMLGALTEKARASGIGDIENRVKCADMVDFSYDMKFDAIFIPARSFLHLTEQEGQIACLRNIRAHLTDGGKLALSFFSPDVAKLARDAAGGEYQHQGSYTDPSDGSPIELSFRQTNDLANQVMDITWRFVSNGSEHLTEMGIRWIYPEEFKLLLRLAGFERWELYGDFDGSSFSSRSSEMVWIAS